MPRFPIIGDCKLCGRPGVKLVESHIIPQSFFEPLKGPKGNKPAVIMSGDRRTEFTQSGVYERFLCAQCEELFSPWDSHGKTILFAGTDRMKPLEQAVYGLIDADYTKLKLFGLSILWRAHHAHHEMYKKVQIGSHEPIIRKMILENDAGPPEKYPVLMERFYNAPYNEASTFFEPTPTRFELLRAYALYLHGYRFTVIVDKRPLPDSKTKIILSEKMAPVFMIDFIESDEYKAAKGIVRQSTYRKKMEIARKKK